MPIYKAPNGDTGIYEDAPEGWEEISQADLIAHLESRRIAEVPILGPLTPRQIRMALTRIGLRESVEVAVNAGDQDLKDWWQWSQTFERNHPAVIQMGQALGQAPEQIDYLWTLGATL
jgi:hypothetical protein